MTHEEWLRLGLANGWCGPAVCYTHDGIPMSEAEESEFVDYDFCIHIVRLYEDDEMKNAIEAHHTPSMWRQ